MKNLHFIVAFISLFICATQVRAQYVTIPDANFRAFLQQRYPACFNAQGKMDTACTAITTEIELDCNNQNIADLTGVQYFDGLQNLICSDNNIINFPPLPNGLRGLQCNRCQLTQLPSLPVGLQDLFCELNNLGNLSGLPTDLLALNCSDNFMMTSLPPLPVQLMTLYCMGLPNLTVLPTLPDNLQILNVGGTSISCLPSLPNSLHTFGGSQDITCLPNYTPGLTFATTGLPLCIPNTCLPAPLCDGSGTDCVFPGDTNHDGICNNLDVLPISVLDGQMGVPRANASTGWYGQPATNWNTAIPNTVFDAKFADANGSNTIDSLDMNVIYTNYNRTNNGRIPTNRSANNTSAAFPVSIVFVRDTFNLGVSDTVTADIFVGSTALNATNFYGFAASVTYDSTVFKPLSIQYNTASFIGNEQQVNVFGITNAPAQKYDIAIARRTRTNVTGQGRVARIKGIIAENVAGKGGQALQNIALSLGITNVLAINIQNQSLPTTAVADQCVLTNTIVATENQAERIEKNIRLFPNPIAQNGILHISSQYCQIEALTLSDIVGKTVLSQKNNNATNPTINVQHLNSGIYFLHIQTDKGNVTKKIVIN